MVILKMVYYPMQKIRQRGSTSRFGTQKSFRIKLDKNISLWSGERRIQLIKSPFDSSRIRNKLSYDLFAEIPHIPSMRSQFVNLTIEDQSVVQNLGLYTQVEFFGKEYLERRGWDKDSGVYKVEQFYFRDSGAFALDVEGKPINEAAFERLIEIKRGDNHEALVEMIKAVNNPNLDFQTEIFDKYFNQDNYLTWFAINMLTNNDDTNWHNYYLYNPIDADNFYFVPWDYDLAWGAWSEYTSLARPRFSNSPAYYWDNNLHKRFFMTPGNLALIKEAVAEIKQKYLTVQKIAAKRDTFYDAVFPLISSSPDWDFINIEGTDPEKVAAYNQVFESLSHNVEENHARFIARFNDPMPFLMSDVVIDEDNIVYMDWSESESLSDQIINYELQIATDIFFTPTSIIQTISDISESEYLLDWIYPKGIYYYRVIARDSANPNTSWQIGYNSVIQGSNGLARVYGVKSFRVDRDGEMNPSDPNEPEPNIESGGSFSWLMLLTSMLLFKKRLHFNLL
ncbi:MAG: CotH kinase family protein [Cocleimonas sp.]